MADTLPPALEATVPAQSLGIVPRPRAGSDVIPVDLPSRWSVLKFRSCR